MKQSSILKWAQNGNKSNHNSVKVSSKSSWIHPPDALQRGHVAYLVKFLGYTDVEQPKGIDVVKEGIRKLKFNQHLKRAEGAKTPKVELTISIDGVAIQDPKTKKNCHQYPLHRISYCADDKTDKKFFSFIAKESDTEKHCCFVFVSDKLAEEITLTIGQAFDLAYKKFLESSGRDLEMKRQLMILQKRVRELEQENCDLKAKLSDYGDSNASNGSNGSAKFVADKWQTEKSSKASVSDQTVLNGSSSHKQALHAVNATHTSHTSTLPPLQPPPSALPRTLNRSFSANQSINLLDIDIMQTQPSVGRKLENLKYDDENDFNPRANDSNTLNASEVKIDKNGENNYLTENSTKDLFGCEPFANNSKDPFGMGLFGQQELESAIGAIDKKLAEMRDGFSRGLSFGNDEFSLECMDPLNQKIQK